jgi:hypothetical protein
MNARRQLDRALKRAEDRDRKRRPKMAVTGKAVFKLNQLLNQRPKRNK